MREILRELDPNGVDASKKGKLIRNAFSAGPDKIWAYDGHDKSVKYGLAIHGCVDSWSGKYFYYI